MIFIYSNLKSLITKYKTNLIIVSWDNGLFSTYQTLNRSTRNLINLHRSL
jgi:hypothetical protein